MADNTRDEHLENLSKIQSENPLSDIIPTNYTETINTNQETENMEVHHHVHDPAAPHHKKNWKSYFWEFLMLFLAVFCGFLAEYQLEHVIEHQREKKYAALLYTDLKSDTAGFNLLDSIMLKKITQYKKSKPDLINSKKLPDSTFARIATSLWSGFEFRYTSTTFNQMKTSGSLRYFQNDSLIAKLSAYYDKRIPDIIRHFDFIDEKLHTQIEPIFAEYFTIFENSPEKFIWTPSKGYINRSANSDMIIKNRLYLFYFGVSYNRNVMLKRINERADQLLKLLKEEYHLN